MTAPNTLFPGRPDYVGPSTGVFAMLHHDVLAEKSHDVMERVLYVKREKPKHEVAIRLHNMMYLGEVGADYLAKRDALQADYLAKFNALSVDYLAKRAPLDGDYLAKFNALSVDYLAKRDALQADYAATCAPLDAELLSYISKHIPDHAWNGYELNFGAAA